MQPAHQQTPPPSFQKPHFRKSCPRLPSYSHRQSGRKNKIINPLPRPRSQVVNVDITFERTALDMTRDCATTTESVKCLKGNVQPSFSGRLGRLFKARDELMSCMNLCLD